MPTRVKGSRCAEEHVEFHRSCVRDRVRGRHVAAEAEKSELAGLDFDDVVRRARTLADLDKVGAVAVDDAELIAAVKEIGAAEGIFCAPEGAACLPALRKLIDQDLVEEGDTVVLFNTGSGVKYLEAF